MDDYKRLARDKVIELAMDEDIMFMDGYDDCLLPMIGRRFNSPALAVYDIEKVIAHHMADGMTMDEAIEFFEYNQIGGWVGDHTPLFIERA
jgi:hypothetical protein